MSLKLPRSVGPQALGPFPDAEACVPTEFGAG